MTRDLFERELDYGAAMSIAKSLLRAGLITDKEYRKIDTIFTQKYRPVIGGLNLEIP